MFYGLLKAIKFVLSKIYELFKLFHFLFSVCVKEKYLDLDLELEIRHIFVQYE